MMQDNNQQRTMNNPKDFFKEAKCQIQKKNSTLKIYHQMNLKQLINNFLTQMALKGETNQEIDLGVYSKSDLTEKLLKENKGSFGVDWASIRIKSGLMLDYKVNILSFKEEVETLKEKSHESSKTQTGKLNLIKNLDNEQENENFSSENSKAEIKEDKIVFPITIGVSWNLRLEKDIKR